MYLLEDVAKKGKNSTVPKKVATFKPKFDLEAHQRALMVVASE